MTRAPAPRRKTQRPRAAPPEERGAAILGAAQAVFLEKGFAAARVEDVAARAGIAKGTVYLHFASKEELLKALVLALAVTPVGHLDALLADEQATTAELLRRALAIVRTEVLETDRRLLLRLLLTEGARFPDIAEFHHREVVSRAMGALRAIIRRGTARGEVSGDALARFPQLFAAPMLMAIVWEMLFADVEPLDLEGLLESHLDLLLHGIGGER